ncbi:MAG: glycosyltransferase family 9 protein [Candidatus Omnitrophica bacterium]|nr:glycosyltransferase family 9 protein [Candidatus Omnitrophota bacterium]MCB9746861.1 glycosyltransferase family 9 protein [Candidatus Omnitrophota bacterium]
MPLIKSKIKKILLISLTNIGDVVLTFPVFDVLRQQFPDAEISLVIGPKADSLFKEHPEIKQIYIYDKHQPHIKTIRWMITLWKQRFDLVVDLRNTAIPFLIFPKQRTPLHTTKDESIHMQKKHLNRLKTIMDIKEKSVPKKAVFISKTDQQFVHEIIKKEIQDGAYVVFAPGSAFHAKRWSAQGFAWVADDLMQKYQLKAVFVGDENDQAVVQEIQKLMKHELIDLCGRLSLIQLASLLQGAFLAVVNDSAPMHLASYLNIPVLALFGPSDPEKYGPWSENCIYLTPPGKNQEIATISSDRVINAIAIHQGKISFQVK